MCDEEQLVPAELAALWARDVSELADRLAAGACEDVVYPSGESARLLIREAHRLSVLADRVLVGTVRHGREAGLSWQEIASMLGITRQTAYDRFSSISRKTLNQWATCRD